MQSPVPYAPPGWAPPRQSSPQVGAVIGVVVAVVVAVIVYVIVFGVMMSSTGAPPAWFLFVPILGIVLFIVFAVVAIAVSVGGLGRTPLPPPPPIQQPMVPAGMQGPIALNCPNCGAPPGAVDRFGVATCTHCATRFLVR